MTDQVDLRSLGEQLLAQARTAEQGRASATVVHGERQRAVLMAFTPGTGLGEHEAPPAATLQVLRGGAELRCADQAWDLAAGDLVPIPQARHLVEVADQETLVLLTVSLG